MAVAAMAAACGDTPTSPGRPRPTGSLSGTVTGLSPDGAIAVEGAVVTHVGAGRSATTDSTGAYSITEILDGSAMIIATKEGYQTQTTLVAVSGGTRLDLELVPRREPFPPGALSGRVFERTAAGQVPVPGVVVEDSNFHWGAVTDADGRYRIDYSRLNPGPDYVAILYVAKEGFQPLYGSIPVQGDVVLDIELVRR
jgi:hypothetical protein